MANRLAYFLRRIPVDAKVNVCFKQVVELIGEQKARELAKFVTEKSEVTETRVGPRSAIPQEKRVRTDGMCECNRNALLEAIETKQGKDFQRDGTEPKEMFQAKPNPVLLKKR